MRPLLLSVGLLLLPTPILAADWLEFRGPDGKGTYTGPALPTKWGTDTNVVWKAAVPGKGWSSPIVIGDDVVLTTAVPSSDSDPKPDYSLRVLCFSAKDGSKKWEKEIFVEEGKSAPLPHKKNSHASPTPVSDGKLIFSHFGHMGTACLKRDGTVVWKTQKLKFNPVHGNGGSPILVGDKLIITCDGKDDPCVAALDVKTGEVAWKTPRENGTKFLFSFATPQVIEQDGKKVIVAPASHAVMGYEPETGKELWRVKYPKPGWSVITRPVFGHGLLYVCTGYVNQHLMAFPPTGSGDLTEKIVWKTPKHAPNTPTPLLIGSELYTIADDGFMNCYDAKTGNLHWSERLAGRGYSASPITDGKNIYVTSEEGVGQIIEAKKEFTERGKFDLGEKTFATFVPVDGALYVRTETQLYKFAEKK